MYVCAIAKNPVGATSERILETLDPVGSGSWF